MNYRLWSGRGAICFAPVLVAQVVARNWGSWEAWPFWVDDIIAATLLIVGGYLSLDNDTTTNSRVLTGAWFFAAAGAWVSLFRILFEGDPQNPAPAWLLALTLVSLLVSFVGCASSLPSKRVVGGGGQKAAAPRAKRRSHAKSKQGA